MYAVVETGGKQYKVAKDDLIKVEKLNANVGEKISLKVLLTFDGDKVTSASNLKDSEVLAEVVEHGKGKKLVIFKYKPKKRIRKKQGHRQPFTTLKIVSVK